MQTDGRVMTERVMTRTNTQSVTDSMCVSLSYQNRLTSSQPPYCYIATQQLCHVQSLSPSQFPPSSYRSFSKPQLDYIVTSEACVRESEKQVHFGTVVTAVQELCWSLQRAINSSHWLSDCIASALQVDLCDGQAKTATDLIDWAWFYVCTNTI